MDMRLPDRKLAEESLGMELNGSLAFVAYESENTIENRGSEEWTEETGSLSIWMLAMFNPSDEGVVFIPFSTVFNEQERESILS